MKSVTSARFFRFLGIDIDDRRLKLLYALKFYAKKQQDTETIYPVKISSNQRIKLHKK